MRKMLMEILSRELPVVGNSLGGRIISYQLPDGTVVGLTAEDGMAETVSLRSAPWKQLDFYEKELRVQLDAEKRIAVFSLMDGKTVRSIKHEAVLKLPLGKTISLADELAGYPQMLPDNTRLDLAYAVDCPLSPRPQLWIKQEATQ